MRHPHLRVPGLLCKGARHCSASDVSSCNELPAGVAADQLQAEEERGGRCAGRSGTVGRRGRGARGPLQGRFGTPDPKKVALPGQATPDRDRSGRILVRVELIGAPGPGSGAAEGLAALRDLRKALASEDELVAQHAIDAGTIELLQAVLQGTCVDSQLEAAWCVTNIAAGSSAHTEAEILTSQYLVTFNQ